MSISWVYKQYPSRGKNQFRRFIFFGTLEFKKITRVCWEHGTIGGMQCSKFSPGVCEMVFQKSTGMLKQFTRGIWGHINTTDSNVHGHVKKIHGHVKKIHGCMLGVPVQHAEY